MIYKFQEGGEVPQEAAAPAAPEAGAQEAEAQMQQMAQQLAQAVLQQIPDPQAAAAILQMAAEMVMSMAQESAPVYRRNGGKVERLRK